MPGPEHFREALTTKFKDCGFGCSTNPSTSVVGCPEHGMYPVKNEGKSTCPICGTTWWVTPSRDCLIPACGHLGTDTSAANPNRPCEPCGMQHIRECQNKPDMGLATLVPQKPQDTFLVVNRILDYEAGRLDEEQTVVLFQHLVDTGLAWSLQGHYGRTAQSLIDQGLVNPASA